MTMKEWSAYFMGHRRNKTLNVISLEFSKTRYSPFDITSYRFTSRKYKTVLDGLFCWQFVVELSGILV